MQKSFFKKARDGYFLVTASYQSRGETKPAFRCILPWEIELNNEFLLAWDFPVRDQLKSSETAGLLKKWELNRFSDLSLGKQIELDVRIDPQRLFATLFPGNNSKKTQAATSTAAKEEDRPNPRIDDEIGGSPAPDEDDDDNEAVQNNDDNEEKSNEREAFGWGERSKLGSKVLRIPSRDKTPRIEIERDFSAK